MSLNTYKEEVAKLAKKIKKEHFIKVGLWIAGIVLTCLWLAFTIGTSISIGQLKIYGDTHIITSLEEIQDKWNTTTGYEIKLEQGQLVAKYILDIKDLNPLCLTYSPHLVGWYIAILLSPTGYMGIIFIIAVYKNMITPSQVKKVVRRALQFGYLKQKDVEYVCDEIDYNIGLKDRIYQEEKPTITQEEVVYEKEQTRKQENKKPIFSQA